VLVRVSRHLVISNLLFETDLNVISDQWLPLFRNARALGTRIQFREYSFATEDESSRREAQVYVSCFFRKQDKFEFLMHVEIDTLCFLYQRPLGKTMNRFANGTLPRARSRE